MYVFQFIVKKKKITKKMSYLHIYDIYLPTSLSVPISQHWHPNADLHWVSSAEQDLVFNWVGQTLLVDTICVRSLMKQTLLAWIFCHFQVILNVKRMFYARANKMYTYCLSLSKALEASCSSFIFVFPIRKECVYYCFKVNPYVA